ncbi:hypothetical protein Ae263Ps1_1146c [Pseudonocardia sp. Ae263_Ps1]|nr:hypothetical protein Ae150APs1_4177 [Pseudonocardia sp. Ae150A_Ps1]OLL84091.1 hypothetical protein Ae263Ps1_1146c [Pseudonocardia sp. Ae263_Ps1]OLL95891.1 hypothetical protein Ae356Ps1_5788 [Pseudonocardia sp. Ae356_Ps1]
MHGTTTTIPASVHCASQSSAAVSMPTAPPTWTVVPARANGATNSSNRATGRASGYDRTPREPVIVSASGNAASPVSSVVVCPGAFRGTHPLRVVTTGPRIRRGRRPDR